MNYTKKIFRIIYFTVARFVLGVPCDKPNRSFKVLFLAFPELAITEKKFTLTFILTIQIQHIQYE